MVHMLRPQTVRTLSELVASVKDEQAYIVVRERTHRNTAESTNARVKWWSIFQLSVVIGEGVFQVWWLKRFFEVSITEFFLNVVRLTFYIGQTRRLSSVTIPLLSSRSTNKKT